MDGADPLTVAPSPAPGTGPHRSHCEVIGGRGTALVGVLVFAVLACWAAVIGRYGGPDEPAHVVRAYAVAQGDLLGEPVDGLPPGYRSATVPASLGTGDPSCYRHDPTIDSSCAAALPGGDVAVATSAGTNPPLYYALVGVPVRVLGAAGDPLAYRLVGSALVAIVLALTLLRLRADARALALAVAIVTPSCWFLWGVVNPNALEIALVALAATGVVRGRHGPQPSTVWWTAVPLGLSIAMRPVSVLWAGALLVVCELEWRRRLTRRMRLALWGVPALGVVTVFTWARWSALVVDDDRTAGTGSRADALRGSISGLPTSARELVGSLGWLEYHAPWIAVAAWVIAVVLVVRTRPVAARSTWLVLALALVAVPVVFEVVLDERVGPIWQGRYSLPVAATAGVIALGSRSRVIGIGAARGAVALGAVSLVVVHWYVARRSAVGTDGSWWFHDAAASGRVFGPGTWVAVHATFVVVLAAVAMWRLGPNRPDTEATIAGAGPELDATDQMM